MFILHSDREGVNASQCTIELGYNVTQRFCVVLNECRCNRGVMVNSEELIGTAEYLTL
jgi:hypothetical protein